jgi:hypothetical protein
MNWLIGLFSPLWRDSTQRAAFKVAPLAILVLAAALRLHHLDRQSLWNDEGNSLRLAERSIPDLIAAARLDIHPPGYYLLLKGWWWATGESEFALRAFSALASVLTVACVYALGQALYSPGAGVVAALFVAVNTFSIYYAQEARMYALLALGAAASMLAFMRWMLAPRWRRALPLALVNAAGLYTHYVFPFVMLGQGVMLLIYLGHLWLSRSPRVAQVRHLGQYFALNLITLALFLPQVGAAWAQVTGWPRTGQPIAAGEGAGILLQWLTFGNTALEVPWWVYVLMGVAALAALLPDWLTRPIPSWWRRMLPVTWLVIAITPFFALGLFREANLKFLLPAQIAAALLIGRGLWLLWQLGSANFFILSEAFPRLIALAGLYYALTTANDAIQALYTDPRFERPDYRRIALNISSDPREGDAIILNAPNQEEVFRYYYRGAAPIYPLPRGLGGDDATTIRAVEALVAQYRRVFVIYWGEAERDPNRVVEKTLTDRAYEVASAWFGDVRFVQYAMPPTSLTVLRLPPTRFGEAITLRTAALSSTAARPGEVLALAFTWETDRPLAERFKVFIHLLNGEGALVAQRDSEPGNNLQITTLWQPGVPVDDAHGLILPRLLPAGEYQLVIGLYNLDVPTQRLAVGAGDVMPLATITILPADAAPPP